jgi:hypothetical protein
MVLQVALEGVFGASYSLKSPAAASLALVSVIELFGCDSITGISLSSISWVAMSLLIATAIFFIWHTTAVSITELQDSHWFKAFQLRMVNLLSPQCETRQW